MTRLASSFLLVFAAAAVVLASGCASRKTAPPPTVVEPAVSADTTDPSWTPPDESGMAVSEEKLESPEAAKSKTLNDAPQSTMSVPKQERPKKALKPAKK